MTGITYVSAHDFLYDDRHRKFYPDIKIYLGGNLGRLPRFIQLLEEGRNANEICQELKLVHRGDVWFATLLVHLHIRDGLYERPGLSVDIPPELAANMEDYEEVWRHRNDPPPATTRH